MTTNYVNVTINTHSSNFLRVPELEYEGCADNKGT